ncbi:MAG: glycosyltransferase family 2 protein [Bacteroidales bacterium]|nr:glycosyltransferase family 2 protein [Bacteroidales bacterium]
MITNNNKFISVVVPCYNEEENVEAMCLTIKKIFEELGNYDYENIFIDNASKDNTVNILRRMAEKDKNVKVIVNARNFGHIRSPHHGLLQSTGDGIILIPCDFQEPPEMIKDFISEWEKGYKIVVGVKKRSRESKIMFFIRKMFYNLIGRLSETGLIKNFTGFGLYDKKVIDIIREINDPYPYFRGLICEIGYEIKKIEYTQARRKRGITKNNFYTLFDMAMLGITSHSKVPLRLATIIGFLMGTLSFIMALIYLALKIFLWKDYPLGFASMIIGIFFFASIQLFFIGIIGEYIGAIYTQVMKRPLVIEKERINFD